MASEKELFYASLARTWELLTPAQLVSILVDQADGGPSLPVALEGLGCATDDKVAQMYTLADQVFRNPLADFELDMLPEAGMIDLVECDACGETAEIEDYDARQAYSCAACGEVLPARAVASRPPALGVEESGRVLPIDYDIDQTGEVVIATEDDDLDDEELGAVAGARVNEISLDATGTHYDVPSAGPAEQIRAQIRAQAQQLAAEAAPADDGFVDPEFSDTDIRALGFGDDVPTAETPLEQPPAPTGSTATGNSAPPIRRRRRQNIAPVIVGLELDADDPRALAAAAAAAGPAGGGSWTEGEDVAHLIRKRDAPAAVEAAQPPAAETPAAETPAVETPAVEATSTEAPSPEGPTAEAATSPEGPTAEAAPSPEGPTAEAAPSPEGPTAEAAPSPEGPTADAPLTGVQSCACQMVLQPEWRFCPSCGASTTPCGSCARPLQAEWKVCPYCTMPA